MAIATWRYKRGIEQFVSEHKRNPTLDELISRNSGPLWLETVTFDWKSRSSIHQGTQQTSTGGTNSRGSSSSMKSSDPSHIQQGTGDAGFPMSSGSSRTNAVPNEIPPPPMQYGKDPWFPYENEDARSRADARGRSLMHVMHSGDYTVVDSGAHSSMAGQDFYDSDPRRQIYVQGSPQYSLEEIPAIFKDARDPMKNPKYWIPDGAAAQNYPDSTLQEMRLQCVEAVTLCHAAKVHEISLRMAMAPPGAPQSRCRRSRTFGCDYRNHGRQVRVNSPEPFREHADEVEWLEIYSDEGDAAPDSIPKCTLCMQKHANHRESKCNFYMRGKIPNELDKCQNCGMDPPNHLGSQCVFERNTFDLRTCQLELYVLRLQYQMSLLKKNNEMLHDTIYKMQVANLPKESPPSTITGNSKHVSFSTSADASASGQIHSNPMSFDISDGLDLESTDEDSGPDMRCALAKSSDVWRKCHKADRLQRWKDMIIAMKRRPRNNRIFTYAMNQAKAEKAKGNPDIWQGYRFLGIVSGLTKECKWNNLQAKFMVDHDPTIQELDSELNDQQIRNYRRKNALEIQKLVDDHKVRINNDASPPLLQLITADNRRFQWTADRFIRRIRIPPQPAGRA